MISALANCKWDSESGGLDSLFIGALRRHVFRVLRRVPPHEPCPRGSGGRDDTSMCQSRDCNKLPVDIITTRTCWGVLVQVATK